MDVDLLRPGTVPISADTSLWFEFLLDPSHLEKHLKNPHADPTPTELITKFLNLSFEKPSGDATPTTVQKPFSKRCLALKILALKVAAYLKWDLDDFEKMLSLASVTTLLKDFLYVINPSFMDIDSHSELKFSELPPHALYAIFLYHRWILKAFVNLVLRGKTKQVVEIPPEEISESEAEKSAAILKKMSDEQLTLRAPSLSCFAVPGEEHDPNHAWNNGETLEGKRVTSEILLALSVYLVNRNKYPEARASLSECLSIGVSDIASMSGLCIAVGVRPKLYSPSLSQQFHEGIAAKYINIDKVLEKDNSLRQIPIAYRQGLELDITSEVANGTLITARDGVAVIRALNAVRVALDGGVQLHGPPHSPTALTKAISGITPLSAGDKRKLEYYLLQLLANSELSVARMLAAQISKLPLLSEDQISAFIDHDYDSVDHPSEQLQDSKCTTLEIASLERLVLSNYDPVEIKTALKKLFSLIPGGSWDKLDDNWDVPPDINAALNSLPSVFSRNYAFILIAKSYELDLIKAYSRAEVLLKNVLEELGNSKPEEELKHLLSREILYINIHLFHSMWPAKQLNWGEMTERCLAVLSTARMEVRDAAALTLLNAGAWAPLANTTALKSPLLEIYQALARASIAISQFNGKVTTEAWDRMIPLFVVNKNRREQWIMRGLCDILEPNALSLVISLLARIHNILIDQPSLDISIQLTHIWPTTLKNASQYSLKQVTEFLFEILEHSLEYYPYNLTWLKVMGDLHFVSGHYRNALASYLEAAAVGTEHFSRPLHRNILEDHVIKRMIKSCSQLQCHTQAGLLCQLLEETDYNTAYKCLSEASPSDASDSYHQCIWDINILEFLISLHAKRGDHHRKQALVRMIGLLELNSNNNEEIKREAENIRKSHFLRAMASQYL